MPDHTALSARVQWSHGWEAAAGLTVSWEFDARGCRVDLFFFVIITAFMVCVLFETSVTNVSCKIFHVTSISRRLPSSSVPGLLLWLFSPPQLLLEPCRVKKNIIRQKKKKDTQMIGR